VSGGQTAQVATKLVNPQIAGLGADGSALLVLIGSSIALRESMWSLPLPVGDARRLGDTEVTDANLFPDGRLLYLLGSIVYVAAKDGSAPRKLAEISQYNLAIPMVSPDADRVVVSPFDPSNNEWGPIFEMGADGTGLREVLKGGQGELPPIICCGRWTADGKHLLFRGLSEGRWDLWAVSVDHRFLHNPGTPVRLTNGPLSYEVALASRDGKVFTIGTQRRGELVRYDANSQEFIPYLGGISAFDPTFSRDGKWVVYASYPDHALWRSRSNGSDRLKLTYPPIAAMGPRISADGRKVTFHTSDGVAYFVSMDGGTPQKLAENAWFPDWSPDGNLVTFTSIVSGKRAGEKGYFQTRIDDLRNRKVSIVPESLGRFHRMENTSTARLVVANPRLCV